MLVHLLRKWSALIALGALACGPVDSLLAQTENPSTQPPIPGRRPSPPTGTFVPPGFSIEIQPGSGVVTDPITGANSANPITPGASASFDPPMARVGRPVAYVVTITSAQRVTDLPAITPPDGLQLEQGPRGYSMSSLNGQLVSTSTIRYTATAHRAGAYVIPAFPVQVGGLQVQVPSARLLVSEPQPGEPVYQSLRAAIDVPKRDFFIGETIEARLLFIDTADEQAQYVQHVAKSSGGVLFKPSMRTRREQFTWEGKPATGLVMPVQITPLIPGDTEFNCQVIVHVARNDVVRRGILTQATLDVPSVHFRVLALPQARPAGFTGGIGQFTVSQPKLSAPEVEVGEPLMMTISLTGEGNIDGVPAPELPAGGIWSTYRPTSEVQREDDGLSGTKTFTYTLIPRQEGKHGTPTLPFAYFDPVKRTFVDITIPPVPVLVKASTAAATNPATGNVGESAAPTEPPRETTPALTGLADRSGAWHQSPGPALKSFLWFQLIPPALILALWLWRRHAEHLARNPQIARRRQARAAARKALANARAAVRRGDHRGFLTAGVGALRHAAAPLDTADAGSLTREEVLRQLRQNDRASRAARTIFETAEASQYASREADLQSSATLLPDLEHAVAELSSRR